MDLSLIPEEALACQFPWEGMGMKTKHILFNLAAVLVLLSSLGGVNNASAAGEIIPADRKIDWSYAGIPGGIPEGQPSAPPSTAPYTATGQQTQPTPSRMRSTAARTGRWCTCRKAPTSFTSTIHLYDYDTLRGAGPGKTILKHTGGYLQVDGRHARLDLLAAGLAP